MRRIINFSLLLIFFFTSYYYNNSLKKSIELAENNIRAQKLEVEKNYIPPEKDEELIFYYPNEMFTELLSDKVKIRKGSDLRYKLNSILAAQKEKTKDIKKYNDKESFVFIDEYLEVENFYLHNGILYVDFNLDFRSGFFDKKHELYFTYSLVNSFVEIEGIDKIKFLILGKEVNEFKYYDLNDFLYKYDLRG